MSNGEMNVLTYLLELTMANILIRQIIGYNFLQTEYLVYNKDD